MSLKQIVNEKSLFQMRLEMLMKMESEFLSDGSLVNERVKKSEIHEMKSLSQQICRYMHTGHRLSQSETQQTLASDLQSWTVICEPLQMILI